MPQNPMPYQNPTPNALAASNANFMGRVYAWMAVGLTLTAGVGFYVANSRPILETLFGNVWMFYVLIALELGAVIYLNRMIKTMSSATATLLYLGYAALSGVTFSTIFLIYARESITEVFGITAFAFGGLSVFGLVTKRVLGPVGSFCMMGFWGVLGYGLVAMFFPSWMGTPFDKTMALVGVIVFSGLTAYDTQKIKNMSAGGFSGSEDESKGAIMGALMLYLDFVNLFLMLLRLMGRRK
jgi:FtsH-binding integral membrane protein